jgi:hypothetical protein
MRHCLVFVASSSKENRNGRSQRVAKYKAVQFWFNVKFWLNYNPIVGDRQNVDTTKRNKLWQKAGNPEPQR